MGKFDETEMRNVLVGVVRDVRQLQAALNFKFYHMPAQRFKIDKPPKYVALYVGKGLQANGCGIRYYGRVTAYGIVKRSTIKELPKNSEALYHYFTIQEWITLKNPVIMPKFNIYAWMSLNEIRAEDKIIERTVDSKNIVLNSRMLEILKKYFGYAEFRSGQESVINNIMAGRDVIGIMPTGAGKSICYQVSAMLLDGITLVVSPLISLMQDQVKSLVEAGIRAAYINSSLTDRQLQKVFELAKESTYKIIYVAPERLLNRDFLDFALDANISMVTVDEAHCVSQWGQDFRPSYLTIGKFVSKLKERPKLSAFTATATEKVSGDIGPMLGMISPKIVSTGFDRKNLYFSVRHLREKQKDAFVLEYVKKHKNDSGIIYCGTRKKTEKIFSLLKAEGIAVGMYHAGMETVERRNVQDDFIFERLQVMVATNAFGMGINKSNVRYVIHYNMPECIENYYQEAGRAGRDGLAAECILLYGRQDIMLRRYFLEHKEYEGVPEKDIPLLQERDEQRLQQMIEYCEDENVCLRNAILKYFGVDSEKKCGFCGNCCGKTLDGQIISDTDIVPARRSRREAARAALTDEQRQLFDKLREWRMDTAEKKRVPPYLIFSDKTLLDMAKKCPRNRQELMNIYGVGEYKCDVYGNVILKVISEYCSVFFK